MIPTGESSGTGKSAYDYALDGGYKGTESEFALKLAELGNSNWQATKTAIANEGDYISLRLGTNESYYDTYECSTVFTKDSPEFDVSLTPIDNNRIIGGESYSVYWNGIAYVCEADSWSDGAGASLGKTGYPFYIQASSSRLSIFPWVDNLDIDGVNYSGTYTPQDDEELAVTLKIEKMTTIYNVLPDNYLPKVDSIDLLIESDTLLAVTDSDGCIITDENENIIMW